MQFWDTEPSKPEFDYEVEKQKFIDNMDYLASMTVEEQTLYKKWVEWNADLPSSMKRKAAMAQYIDQLWSPTDIMNKEQTIQEIDALDPYVEIVADAKESTRWTEVRKLIHTMSFSANPGRNIKLYIKDRVSGKLLGLVSLGSDVTSLGVRDTYIGWDKENKYKHGRLNHTTIASTIVCTQPLGYNFLGGKLVACMTTSPIVRNHWKEKYGQELIAVGTTSLYGIHSQYNGIPHFKTLGESAGKVSTKPDDSVYEPWHHWVRDNLSDDYIKTTTQKEGIEGPVSGVKQRILSMIFKELGIKQSHYQHGFKRGVYFAQMYDNGNEFLRNEIDASQLKLKKKFEGGDDYTMNWWKPKAIRRYSKLLDEGRIKPEPLFYLDIIGMSWEDAKKKYLKEVGR
tara:strand:- start:4226 stop:5416 length:1191 start_codon:yes stop_codon:yes gene_type:complete